MTPNTYLGGGMSLTVLVANFVCGTAGIEHFWYAPEEVAQLELERDNLFFAQACVDYRAVPPTSTHFH